MEKVEILSFDNILEHKSNLVKVESEKDILQIECFEPAPKVVCFTGNRPAKLPWKSNEECPLCVAFKQRLNLLIEGLIKRGANHFIVGGALGVDTFAAEAILSLKHNKGYKITLEVAVPCLGQTTKWKPAEIQRYNLILEHADCVSMVSNLPYTPECYAVRNRFMVDKADLVIAGLFVKGGGTMQTINYAKKKNKNIIIIN